jgi:hypothetical protein
MNQLRNDGTARCAISYPSNAVHQITAQYTSDPNFLDSSSAPAQQVTVGPVSPATVPTVTSTMQWTFFYTSSHTQVRALTVNHPPRSGRVVLRCLGRRCPFRRVSVTVPGSRRRSSLGLSSTVGKYVFPVGTRLAVAIVRSQWVGKYYSFMIRAGRPPSVAIRCLPPGQTRPGGAC